MISEDASHHAGIKKYCDTLEEIKLRIKAVQNIVNKKVDLTVFENTLFTEEFIFIQIRKILELVVFGSMSSNIALYEKTYADYTRHEHAKNILKNLKKINPNFYPLPLQQVESDKESIHLENVENGYLTKEDFIFLYDTSSQIIHAPNPYAVAQKIDLKMSINDWMHRIASLLWFHKMQLAGTDEFWFVYLVHPETKRSKAIKSLIQPR